MNLLSIPFLCVGHKDLLASCPELMGLCLLPLIVDGLNQFICFCIQLRICGATFLQLYQCIRILLAQQGDEQFAASSIGIQNIVKWQCPQNPSRSRSNACARASPANWPNQAITFCCISVRPMPPSFTVCNSSFWAGVSQERCDLKSSSRLFPALGATSRRRRSICDEAKCERNGFSGSHAIVKILRHDMAKRPASLRFSGFLI